MSIVRNYYVIVGYDLTDWKTDKYDGWKWTDDGEEYTCYQVKGRIQLFDDPMCGEHLYLGYIFASGDQYDFETVKVNTAEFERQMPHVSNKLDQLIDIGVISKDIFESDSFRYEVIIFEERT